MIYLNGIYSLTETKMKSIMLLMG